MTTPARIAAFLSTSALCLGLASGPAYAEQRDADGPREARTLTRDRDAARSSGIDAAAEATQRAGADAAADAATATAGPAQARVA